MAIDVFFTGLMLICLDGQPNCPAGKPGSNRAWVVNADGKSEHCGLVSSETTKLDLRFPTAEFFQSPSGVTSLECKEDPVDKSMTRCNLPPGKICTVPHSPSQTQVLDKTLDLIPRLAEVDRRFMGLDETRLSDPRYVSGHIDFPQGVIGAGAPWPKNGKPTQWYRSNDQADTLPRPLSDRLKAAYTEATGLEVTNCENKLPLLTLTLKPHVTKAEIEFRNLAVDTSRADVVSNHDSLAYLLWYDELGKWNTLHNVCPRDAVQLSCIRQSPTDGCACDDHDTCARDHTFWPPMLGGGPVKAKR